jgi:anaerobic C4-dicarboxylate transporter DcuB
MFWIEFAVLLLAIFIGIRIGGLGLGLIGGTGVTVFAFVFGMNPGSPPIDVMLIIIAVVAASATLHAAGGLIYMVQLAEKLLRKHPKYIVFLAPYCTWLPDAPGAPDGSILDCLTNGYYREPDCCSGDELPLDGPESRA